MADSRDRIPPQAIEAEQSVLGAMMQHEDALHMGIEQLNDESFYVPKHRKIFAAIRALYDSSGAVDMLTMPSELERRGQLEDIGGRRYLLDLADSVVTYGNLEHHIRLVLEASIKNQLIADCSDIVGRCYDQANVADDLLDYSESKILSIKDKTLKGDFIALKNILPQTFEQIEEYAKREGHVTGVATGYTDLDSLTAGFQPSDLVIIAGRPSMGKTAFALNIMENIAVTRGTPVALFSLEMAKEQVAQRLLCSRATDIIASHAHRTNRRPPMDESYR